jgi:transcription antitermination factor NusA-like protein
MMSTINMQDMRYLNLFGRITRIETRYCIKYNDYVIFCVPKPLVMRAMGRDGENLRRLSEMLGKKVRIIPTPRGIYDAKGFIQTLVKPVTFKDLEVKGDEMILTAGNMQNKATLMGRGKKRLLEMEKIVKDFFGKEFRII